MNITVIRYTCAPVEYDGFGTVTLGIAGKDYRGDVRKMEIDTNFLTWQESRYQSGGYSSWTEEEFLSLVAKGFLEKTDG